MPAPLSCLYEFSRYKGASPDWKMSENRTITLLLHDFVEGDKTALDGLIPLVYDELRRIADGYLRHERQGHTLQPTALVHALCARMVGQEQPGYRDRGHFLG